MELDITRYAFCWNLSKDDEQYQRKTDGLDKRLDFGLTQSKEEWVKPEPLLVG